MFVYVLQFCQRVKKARCRLRHRAGSACRQKPESQTKMKRVSRGITASLPGRGLGSAIKILIE